MAQRLAKPCSTPACSGLAGVGARYCQSCRSTGFRVDRAVRGSACERGYDADWQVFRRWFLMQPNNIICADCNRETSSDVHHVVKVRDCPQRRLDPTNCKGLCGACHKRRTARGE